LMVPGREFIHGILIPRKPALAGLMVPGREFIHGVLIPRKPALAGFMVPGREFIHGWLAAAELYHDSVARATE